MRSQETRARVSLPKDVIKGGHPMNVVVSIALLNSMYLPGSPSLRMTGPSSNVHFFSGLSVCVAMPTVSIAPTSIVFKKDLRFIKPAQGLEPCKP